MYAIFGCASDFGYNFRHLTPTTLNCGATNELQAENKLLQSKNWELQDRVDNLRGWLIGLVLAFIATVVSLLIAFITG